jgi:EAL domain-containing protein (putative c-di-GMP-specific phosphodiesterase class I)
VVAEGVEEPECLAYLRSIGCDMAQGYLISHPLSASDLLELLGREMVAAA